METNASPDSLDVPTPSVTRRWYVVTDVKGRIILTCGSGIEAHARTRAAQLARDGSPTTDPGPVAFHVLDVEGYPAVNSTVETWENVEWIGVSL